MNWIAINSIATVISMVAFVATALYLRDQLKGQQKDRYLSVTNDLFAIWLAPDFMEAQLWLLHRLEEPTWRDFVAKHRADVGEVAFHRVGSFYDRVGTLVRLGFVNEREILSTVGGHAIAVWAKVGPLVREARRIENSSLFEDFERLMPACRECYVPSLGEDAAVAPFAIDQPSDFISTAALRHRIESDEPISLIDVRHPLQIDDDHPPIPGAWLIPVDDVEHRLSELPTDRAAVVLCA